MDLSTSARWFVATTYGAIAAAAALAPERVPAVFGGTARTAASRTEVRAVYAGIPAAFAAAAARPGDGGALRVVEAASAGMAVGRLAGAVAERRIAPWPTGAFAVLEVALALGCRLARRAGA